MKLTDLPDSVQNTIEALLLENQFPAAKAIYDRERERLTTPSSKAHNNTTDVILET